MAVKIKSVEYLNFMIGGYPGDFRRMVIENNMFTYDETDYDFFNMVIVDKVLSKDNYSKLIEILNKTNFTSWQRKYEDPNIIDGTEWRLEVTYNKRKTSKISFGSNQFPFILDKINSDKVTDCEKDFKRLMKLFNEIINQKNYFY